MPARSTAEMCTKASGWPSSRVMKPKPFIALKNLTVPVAFSPVSWRCGPRSPLRSARSLCDRERIALDLEIAGRDAPAAIDQSEFERLPFGEAGKSSLLDGGDVDEDIFAAIVADDEAEALLGVEEFDDALAFADDLGRHAAAAWAAAATAAAATRPPPPPPPPPPPKRSPPPPPPPPKRSPPPKPPRSPTHRFLSAETVALVSAAPTALAAAPSIKTHAV
jgi:hypothetical protein